MKIGEILKARRIELGYDKTFVAEKVGVSWNTITNIEEGKNSPSFETVGKIVVLYGGELNVKFE